MLTKGQERVKKGQQRPLKVKKVNWLTIANIHQQRVNKEPTKNQLQGSRFNNCQQMVNNVQQEGPIRLKFNNMTN